MKKYKISNITDLSGHTRTDGRYPKRIGSIVTIMKEFLDVGLPLFLNYVEREGKTYEAILKCSYIEQIEENEYGFIITTNNSIYHLVEE